MMLLITLQSLMTVFSDKESDVVLVEHSFHSVT